jgi:uncharacterized membrane protein
LPYRGLSRSQKELQVVVERKQKTAENPTVLSRNIAVLSARREQEEAAIGREEPVAAAITRFSGSMAFVYFNLVVLSFWIAANIGALPILPKWDPNFMILGTVASVEAIFLATFILISQNRMAAMESKRAELDLQVGLLTEHEVTRVVTLVAAIAEKLGVKAEVDPQELAEIKRDVAPETMLDELEDQQRPE